MLLRKDRAERRRSRKQQQFECCCCRRLVPFCWRCRCGLQMCQECMDENRWGLTCNNITWNCPDCERTNNYGNQ